ncbi:MAG: hypothetical protein IPO87_05530 [Flavobacteriales bacterium]|nr:hypothetical protein [Flavobacteriales bacterium]
MQSKEKREVELVVISDVHLGTYGCRAEELLNYLRTIRPRTLILNGDIVDIWQFSKSYFPASHMKAMCTSPNCFPEARRFTTLPVTTTSCCASSRASASVAPKVVNKLVLDLHGELAWFFHGDVF